MGRKLKDFTTAEPEPAQESSPNPEIKAEKKKKKKRKDKDEANPKRKLQETEPQEARKEKKKKKDKKGDDAETETHEGKVEMQRNDGVDDGETVRDGHVVVSGKNVESAKYAPLKSFAESRLPEEVLECCKNFQSPSLIQSRAWPFLLDDRDFIGIAATGSGSLFDF
jgi:ATP-dependent RNA helicase DBP3